MFFHQRKKERNFSPRSTKLFKCLDNNISTSEITPILETYEQQLETFQTSQTFGTLATNSRAVNFSDTNQPLAQTVSYHNKLQPMSTQQKQQWLKPLS